MMPGSSSAPGRRYLLIEAVLAGVRRSGTPVVPAGLRAEVDAVFGDLDGLLLTVARRWHTAFVAHLDAVLEEAPPDLPAAVAELWQVQARIHAASRALLDAHADRPPLVAAAARLRDDVLAATGVDLATITGAPPRYRATTGSASPARPRYRAMLREACRIRSGATAGSARSEGGLR
jgi:hypothetical protein